MYSVSGLCLKCKIEDIVKIFINYLILWVGEWLGRTLRSMILLSSETFHLLSIHKHINANLNFNVTLKCVANNLNLINNLF